MNERRGERRGEQRRVTIAEASTILGISKDAVRMRVKRGTLQSDKAPDGRVYVYLNAVPNAEQNAVPNASFAGRDELVEELRDRVRFLEDQLQQANERDRENRRIVAALTARIPELEAPQDAPETVEEEPERTEPRSETESNEVATGMLSEAEPSLLWERVAVVVLSTVTIPLYIPVEILLGATVPIESPVWRLADLALAISVGLGLVVFPAVFGFRLGRKVTSLRFWRNVAPGAALLGLGTLIVGVFVVGLSVYLLWIVGIPSFVYIFFAVLGNALRRRAREKLIEERPSEFPPEPVSGPRGWTPRQQAVVGLTGTIISALIGFIGTILTVVAAGGGP